MNRTLAAKLLLLSLPLLAACQGGTKLVVADTIIPPKAPLRLIATVAKQSDFSDKFLEELSNRGYGVLDQGRTSALLRKLDLDTSDITDATTLTELNARRVDAVMKIAVTMMDTRAELLENVKITVFGTDGGPLLASIDWTNGWGGMPGSPADRSMRKNIANSAREVALALTRQLGAPGAKASVYMDDFIAARRNRAEAPAVPAAPPARSFASDVDQPIRRGTERPNDFALVIGIEEYQSLPKADYGARDAHTVRKHFEALGVPARNIISLEGAQATGSKLKSYLQQWLPRNVKPNSTLFVYYSGHGAPDPENGTAYLVPWDADPMFLTTTAYPLKQFYAELAALKAKRVIVALDACFSGAGGRSVLAKGARPLVTKVDESVPAADNLTVLAAASGTEITGSLDEQGHGIFTYYFLKGLSGAAKNASGAVTTKSLFDYLKPRVQDEARRQNREQSPTMSGVDGPL